MPVTTAEDTAAGGRARALAAGAGVLALLVGLAVALLAQAPRLAGTNDRLLDKGVVVAPGGRFCQDDEVLPDNAAVLQMLGSTAGKPGPPLEVSVSRGGRDLVRGRAAGGYVDAEATVRLDRTWTGGERTGVTVCVVNRGRDGVAFLGDAARRTERAARVRGFAQPDRVRANLEWYRPGTESWLTHAPVLAQRFFLLKASFLGAWSFWLILGALGAISALAILLVTRRPGNRALWACVGLAVANSAAWAFVTPSFQVIDEVVHSGYVQYVAESHELPRPGRVQTRPGAFLDTEQEGRPRAESSPEARAARLGVPFSLQSSPSWSRARHDQVQRTLTQDLGREEEGGAGAAANNPPLYYLTQVVPYTLASRGSFYDRLLAMRLFSTLFVGAAVGFVFAFLRELLPRRRWAWTVGALAVAFQPVFAWIGGGVNPDGLLWAACSALLYLFARAFRRGLDVRTGAGIGLALATGMLTKASTIGLLPGVALGLLLLTLRARARHDLRPALRGLACVAVPTVVPFVGYLILSELVLDTTVPAVAAAQREGLGNVGEQLVYLWQFYLPRLPFMQDQFVGYPTYPLWQTYFQGFVGRFGYFQYGFPLWVSWVALGLVVPVVALATRELHRVRALLRERGAELATYLVMLAGTLLLIGVAGFRFRAGEGLNFEQPRYVFPLIGLYAAVVALAARGAGRFGPAAGVLLIAVAVGHNLFAVLLTIMRYYAS